MKNWETLLEGWSGQCEFVRTVIAMLANGMTEQQILDDYPDLECEDIREALSYAAEVLNEVPPRRAAGG